VEPLKYLAVGTLTNVTGYALYILMTAFGLPAMTAMSMVYTLACLLGFALNRSWTFRNKTRNQSVFARYVSMQIVGYFTNVTLLMIFYHGFGLPHQSVQLFALVIVAAELYLLSKYFVFGVTRSGLK
jgi:putative flippase GtrA